ncbi:PIN domain-containing protein [Microvirga sp. BT688]|nr:PIN domain-containing protein [Microvirga sp.]
MKTSSYTVLLDACVLYPAPLRDFLIELAAARLFRAKWTLRIHDEWIRNVLKQRPDLTRSQLERTRDLMNQAVLDCLVEDYEELIEGLQLPDPDDRHVLAAAIASASDAIVTFNLKDFPVGTLHRYNIELQHPDDFLHYQFGLNHAGVVIGAKNCRARLRNPPKTAADYLAILESQGLPKTVAELSEYADVI